MSWWLVSLLCVVSFGVGFVMGRIKKSWKNNKKNRKIKGY